MLLLSNPVVFVLSLCVLGGLAGIIAGLFGVGGGMILIPALVILFKACDINPSLAMHTAMEVSMMSVVATSLASLRAHARHNAIDTATIKNWAPFVVLGAIGGSVAATQMGGAFLGLIFSVFLGMMAVFLGILPPNMHALKTVPSKLTQKLLASLIGFFSSLIGVGGGFLTVPALVMCRTPIHRAIGTASVVGLLISFPAAVVLLVWQITHADTPMLLNGRSLTAIVLTAVVVLVPSTTFAAPIGARLAHQLPAVNLRKIFAVLLALVALKMFLGSMSM